MSKGALLFLGVIVTVLNLTPVYAYARDGSHICLALSQKILQARNMSTVRMKSEAFFEASALDCASIAMEMLSNGASIKARNRIGATALSIAASKGSLEVTQLLIKLGANVHHRDLNGVTPLGRAARDGRRRIARILLIEGAIPDAADKKGVTPLMAAAFNGDERMVDLLIKANATTNLEDATGKTALIYASGRAFFSVVKRLIDAGAQPDTAHGNGLTPLMWAAGHANDAPDNDGINTADLLIKAGADVNRQDNRGRSVLMFAVVRDHAEMVAYLLDNGAIATILDMDGKTARQLATTDAIRRILPITAK